MFSSLVNTLSGAVTRYPYIVIVCMLALVAASSLYVKNLNIDASADSLMLENDPDLKYYREIHRHYQSSDEYIVIGFKPKARILDKRTIAFIENLTNRMKAINDVSNVTSISNVPLLLQRKEDEKTGKTSFVDLSSPAVDINKASDEFATSPIYTDNLISADLSTTAIVVNIKQNEQLDHLLQKKYELLDKQNSRPLSQRESSLLEELRDDLGKERQRNSNLYKDILTEMRAIIAQATEQGEFYLAGAPLIGNDMKEFIIQDIRVFGIAIILIMIIALFIFFRRPAWIFLALICAVLNVLLVAGITSLLGFQLTVISSNFIALLIIFSIALSIHVIIRFQEIQLLHPHKNIDEKIKTALTQIITPCFYMVLTSAIAFFSLIASDINPVIIFGYIMILGLFCAFLLTFTVLPALIKLIQPQSRHLQADKSAQFLASILNTIVSHKALTAAIIIGVLTLNLVGITQLTVENRFIDYFKKSTDIHQGLKLIDQKLGGTVPLEVILEAAPGIAEDIEAEGDEEFADYLAELEATQDDITASSYWYNRSGIKKIDKIHDYLKSLPQIGKVLSLSSTEEVFRTINKGEPLEDFHLSLVYSNVPDNIKQVLIAPYLSDDGSQARIIARIKDSDHTLIRNQLLNKISSELNHGFVKNGEKVRLTGISVLYNNVLQSLFRSQILTLGTVFVCILTMLTILFRSLKLAIIGTLPNIFTALFILGLMGILGIPLDIMTITIAAITIGIGVDYAIHYIHRYKKEYARHGDNFRAIHKSQTTVGKALYFTSITITLGFIILVLSNFIPSIYFGLLTSAAMLIALLATFSIIPLLLSTLKPLKA